MHPEITNNGVSIMHNVIISVVDFKIINIIKDTDE